MARWFHSMVLIFIIQTTNLETNKNTCQTHFSVLNWPQLTCTNVNSEYFQHFTSSLNRTHWIKCLNCTLNVIDERTFGFTRNNVSFLELQHCQVEAVKKFGFKIFFLLKLLNLRSNCINYLEPKCFSNLKRLLHLDLSVNYLNILTNNLFSDLVNLDILNLNKNEIFYIQPYAFSGLINLKYLYLSHNRLRKIEDRMFKDLQNLKILYLEHNDIFELHQHAFVNLKNLHYLYLNNNSINYLVQYNFKPLNNLVDLQLRLNNLSEIQVSSFNGLKNLKFLYLGQNQIHTIKPYGFIGLDSLIILDLGYNNFTEIELNYFQIKNLHILWLHSNFIKNIIIVNNNNAEVQNALEVLDLSYNQLSEFNFKLLSSKMPNIKEIVLVNNSFSCDFFTNMYSYYEANNVLVCATQSCNSNSTEAYIDSLCFKTTTTDDTLTNVTDDFISINCASNFKLYICFRIALFLILFYC
ncbi:unnamed protein product [Ceutorhynchus assimilis]|uniref:Uncharacterized protein n=1 Tax=Ceutorhynchus assimilis TaxID=467358 RepID=A0A9N9QMS5_9CUCU|nr:unnamed protein product [Ceutorhynchus assimilis]